VRLRVINTGACRSICELRLASSSLNNSRQRPLVESKILIHVPVCSLALLALAALAWAGPRALWAQSWRASSQVTSASLRTCAAAQAAGRAWAAELRGGAAADGAASIDTRAALWLAGAEGARVFDFLPPAWASDAVKTYWGAPASGAIRLFDVAPLALQRSRPAAVAGELVAAGAACVIYSIGSDLRTDFEEAMLRATACDIFSLRCAVPAEALAAKMAAAGAAFATEASGAAVVARWRFVPFCVNEEGRRATIHMGGDGGGGGGGGTAFLAKSVGNIMGELGHSRVNLLRVDAEGAEHVALFQMTAQLDAAKQPPQLSFVLHSPQSAAAGGLVARFGVVAALIDAGYVLVSRNDKLEELGTELTFIRGCTRIVH
jgi:hypothetical protein